MSQPTTTEKVAQKTGTLNATQVPTARLSAPKPPKNLSALRKSYKTVEVELENGRVTPQGSESLPAKAHALLTILQPQTDESGLRKSSGAGLRRFLSAPGFPLTPEQFRASMEIDFFEQ